MEENTNTPYIFETKTYKSAKTAISKIPYDEIDEVLKRENLLDRNIREEVLDLVDMAKCVMIDKTEVNNDIVRVYRDDKIGWRIKIVI